MWIHECSDQVSGASSSSARKLWLESGLDAIRLDAYDGPSGGGPFYKKCGFTELGRAVYRGVPLVYFEFVVPYDHPEPETSTVGLKNRGKTSRRPVRKAW
jgi:hypothetical protein